MLPWTTKPESSTGRVNALHFLGRPREEVYVGDMVLQPPAKADSKPLVKELLLVLLVEWRDDASSDCRRRELQLPADKEIDSGL
jgi:hypothetical protein